MHRSHATVAAAALSAILALYVALGPRYTQVRRTLAPSPQIAAIEREAAQPVPGVPGPERGMTPLYGAVCSGQYGEAWMLLASGADPNARTSRGFTPMYRARTMGRIEMVDLLLRYGGHE